MGVLVYLSGKTFLLSTTDLSGPNKQRQGTRTTIDPAPREGGSVVGIDIPGWEDLLEPTH